MPRPRQEGKIYRDRKYTEEDKIKNRQRTRDYYKNNKQKVLTSARNRLVLCFQNWKTDPLYKRRMINSAKIRAKKLNLEFNITIEDIIIPDYCPVLGLELQANNIHHKISSPSLDRKDNSKGYIKGNIFVISNRANMIKSDLSINQVISLLQYMEQK